MPLPLLAIGKAALTYGPAIYGALKAGGGGKGLDWNSLSAYSDSLKPQGYLTPEDLGAAASTRGRLRRGVSASAGTLRADAMRRARQRGTGTSSAVEATLGRIGEGEAAGHERAGESAEEQLYNVRLGRERFGQQKALTILGGKIRDEGYVRQSRTLRQTAFLNSLLQLSRGTISALGNGGIDSGTQMDSPLDSGDDPNYV